MSPLEKQRHILNLDLEKKDLLYLAYFSQAQVK